jgi:hypothetical protein
MVASKDPDTRFDRDNHGALLNQLFAKGDADPNNTYFKNVDYIRELDDTFKKLLKKAFRGGYRTMAKLYNAHTGANNARRNAAAAGAANRPPPPARVTHGLPPGHILPGFEAAPAAASLTQPIDLDGTY